MRAAELVLILMATTAATGVASARLRIPSPVLLVLAGAGLSAVPFLPEAGLDPETIFLVFVPPLLYRAAAKTPLHEFHRRLGSIAFLSFTMVFATMVVVAVAAHAAIPGLSWPSAFVLGAIVSPPDSVAAIAMTRSVRLPRSVVTVLQGEGMVNDAAALVAYRVAVAALVTGVFSLHDAVLGLVMAAGVGIGVGLVAGWAIARLREAVRELPVIENTISLLTPFAAYIPADRLGGSGVLAVIAVGLYLGRWAPRTVSPVTRLQAEAMWGVGEFLLEGLIFVLVGFELPRIVGTLHAYPAASLALWGTAVAATVIVSRVVLVALRLAAGHALRQWLSHPEDAPSWQHVLFVSWAGIRGGESLVIALALPLATAAGAALPGRDLIILLTFVVIVATLLLQGLSMGTLTRLLRLRDDGSDVREEALARAHLRAAGIACIAARERAGKLAAGVAERALELLRSDAIAAATLDLRGVVLVAQRAALLELFDRGHLGDAVMRRLLRELDLQAALLA
jgi:CPA1 family monovalent cation:H+ antiporter